MEKESINFIKALQSCIEREKSVQEMSASKPFFPSRLREMRFQIWKQAKERKNINLAKCKLKLIIYEIK
jgi:hypothetical protein